MSRLETLADAFYAELQDMYSAEQQLVKALPKMSKKASCEKLTKAFNDHLEQTQSHVERVAEAFEETGKPAKAKKCEAMAGLVKEAEEMTSSKPNDADNSSVNIRDRDSTAKTPLDQNENKKDIGITANIRSRVADTKMSTNAQNVKIITQNGMVTLRGPVKSADEKKRIEEIARTVAGVDKVSSQLESEKSP